MLKQTKYHLSIVFILWTIFVSSQTTLIEEDFSAGTLPVGWTNVNNGGTAGQIWQFTPTSNGTITAGNISGNYAILDSDDYGNGNNQNATLTTPSFATGSYETITLEYDYQYRDYQSPESCTVEVFNGTSWVVVASYTTNSGDNYSSLSNGADNVTIDITSQVNGASNAQVRFTYIGDWDWWWAIDNVTVTGTLPSSSNAYLGPGGVGNTDGTSDLILWTVPDDITEADNASFTSWTDISGYSSTLTQPNASFRPIIKKSILNGYDVVRFENTNRRLRKTNFTNFATTAISGFYVNKNTDSNDGVLSYATASQNNEFLIFSSNSLRMYRTNTNNNTNVDANNNVWNIIDFRWRSTGGTATMSKNGDNSYTGVLNSGSSIATGGSLALAGEQDAVDGSYAANQAHQGDFSEVILFNSYISEAQRIIIRNYISAKYNIALTANDFYTQDDAGDFDFNVAGIGRASDGSLHTDSQGTGIVRINTPSDLNNDEFLFWGEDVKDANYDFSSSAATDYIETLDTKWRVSKRNDLGTVTVSIAASDLDLTNKQSCAPLRLIVSSSSTFATKTTYDFVLSSGVYTATAVDFSDGDYFTLEYIDTIVVDGTQFYNGSGSFSRPSTADDCYKLLVKSTATGALSLTESANVREVEVESGGKLVVDSEKGLQVTNGITLNGEIRLIDKAQLIQTHAGTSTITGSGNLFVDQNSVVRSKYLYNYFSSPVVTNGASNYTVASVMNDGTIPTSDSSTALAINYVSGLDGNFTGSPIDIPNRWIYTYDDIGGGTYAYDNNGGVGSTKTINTGKGFLFKGPGRLQNYTFVGTPNDGTYSYSGIPANVNILLGNPYPSAFDVQQFLADNSAIGTTIYLWQQAAVDVPEGSEGHYSSGYNGDYAIINSSTSTSGTLPSEVIYIEEAEDATLGGGASVNGDSVDLTNASDEISVEFDELTISVDSLFITYSSSALKTIDIDVNAVSQLTGVNLPSTAGAIDTLGIEIDIDPLDIVLLKSNDANTTSIDNVIVKQKYANVDPPFNYFAIGQGFFFSTDNAGTLEFNNNQRDYIPEGTSGSFLVKSSKKQANDLAVLKLGMNFSPKINQTFHKQIAITFKEGNSFAYDRGFDSPVDERQATDMYWKFPNDDNYYGIAGVQEIDEDLEVPLEIIIETSQTVTLKIDELQNINRKVFLKDKLTNTIFNLSESSANISLDAGIHSDRFYISFSNETLAIEDNLFNDLFQIDHKRNLRELSIKNIKNSIINKISIYTILGQKVIELDDKSILNKKEVVIKTRTLSNSIYILSIETEKSRFSKKFF